MQTLSEMIKNSGDLSQSSKDDLVWVVDEMGPSAVELMLVVASKGLAVFKNTKCCF